MPNYFMPHLPVSIEGSVSPWLRSWLSEMPGCLASSMACFRMSHLSLMFLQSNQGITKAEREPEQKAFRAAAGSLVLQLQSSPTSSWAGRRRKGYCDHLREEVHTSSAMHIMSRHVLHRCQTAGGTHLLQEARE